MPPGARGTLLVMIRLIRLEDRVYATQEIRLGAVGQSRGHLGFSARPNEPMELAGFRVGAEGRGCLRSAARPNEPEGTAEFNGLAIHESKQTQFPMPPDWSP